MPSQPASPSCRTISTGNRCSRSCCSMTGATSFVMKSRIVERRSWCSLERSRSIAGECSRRPHFEAPCQLRKGGAEARVTRATPVRRSSASLPAMPVPDLGPRADATAPVPGGPAAATSGSTLRRAILVHLRQAGPTSPDALATALGASRTGVLQQLHALEAANLVGHSTERHGVGRPRHLYDVTPDAQDLF